MGFRLTAEKCPKSKPYFLCVDIRPFTVGRLYPIINLKDTKPLFSNRPSDRAQILRIETRTALT